MGASGTVDGGDWGRMSVWVGTGGKNVLEGGDYYMGGTIEITSTASHVPWSAAHGLGESQYHAEDGLTVGVCNANDFLTRFAFHTATMLHGGGWKKRACVDGVWNPETKGFELVT